jgi:fatty acid-binding protein DegV
MRRALEVIVNHHESVYGKAPLWVTVVHGQFIEQAEILSDLIRSRLNVAKLEMIRITPALGVHTGPGIVGAAAVPIHYLDGLVNH